MPALINKAVAQGHTGELIQSPGGLFNTPGLDNPVLSTIVRAEGLGAELPSFANNILNPYYGFLASIGAEEGSEPANPCDDAPSGFMTSGTLTAKFGLMFRDTKTISIPETIDVVNAANTDLMLIGNLINPDNAGTLYPRDLTPAQSLDNAVALEQLKVGVITERKLATMLWNGSAAVSTNGYKEFPGLDAQIATGQVDAETNVALAAADSLIVDWQYQVIGSSADIVPAIEDLEYHIYNLARATGLAPMTGVFVMRPMMWRALSNVWPIAYNTQPDMTLLSGGEARVIIDARTNIIERDAMRSGLYLKVNGRQYRVVLDDSITELNSTDGLDTNHFASSIYFVPLMVAGSFPVTYWEHKNYAALPSVNLNGNEMWWSDGGRFLWSMDGSYTCFKLKVQVAPRVVLRTPHLAFKIQNVQYTHLHAPLRNHNPADDYWVGGGVSVGVRNLTLTQNAVWN